MSGYRLPDFQSQIQKWGINPANTGVPTSPTPPATPPPAEEISPPTTPQENNQTHTFDSHESAPVEVNFAPHQNDITIMAATRRGELAVTWLSPEILDNWGADESIDAVLERVSQSDNEEYGHHPTVFSTTLTHQAVGQQHSLIFANSDYNEDGDNDDRGDLPDVEEEGQNLEAAYSDHGYQAELHDNTDASHMFNTIRDQLGEMESGDELVVHYSGHGSDSGAAGTSSKWDRLNPIEGFKGFLGLDSMYNSRVQDLVDQAQDRGIKLVMIFDSCESGHTTDYVRHREMGGLGNQIEVMGDRELNSYESSHLEAAREAYQQVQSNLEQIDHLTSEKPLNFEIDGQTHQVKMDEVQPFYRQQMAHIDFQQSSGTVTEEEANIKRQAIRDVISQRDDEIQELEEQSDRLMGEAYEHLNEIASFDFSDSQVNPNQLRFSSGTSVGLQSGLMVDLRLDYSLMEFSRDRGIGLAFSAGIGTGNMMIPGMDSAPQLKFTEAITFDSSTRFSTEFGFAQTLDTRGEFTPWAHVGASYDVSDQFAVMGGLDVALTDRGGEDNQVNPYLGLRGNF